jgi:hypothetical protein
MPPYYIVDMAIEKLVILYVKRQSDRPFMKRQHGTATICGLTSHPAGVKIATYLEVNVLCIAKSIVAKLSAE